MDLRWWVTVVSAWPQGGPEGSGIVIRMILSSRDDSRSAQFASIDEAVEQLRAWFEHIARSCEEDPLGDG